MVCVKLLHLSDLHIGKRVNECSMLEDQRYILEQIAQLAIERKVDGVDRKSTRLNSSHWNKSRMPSSA